MRLSTLLFVGLTVAQAPAQAQEDAGKSSIDDDNNVTGSGDKGKPVCTPSCLHN